MRARSAKRHAATVLTARSLEAAKLGAAQHGVIARWQLLELGLGPKTVSHWLTNGRLHRLHAGVYALGHARVTLFGRYMAAVLAGGPAAVLSHWSAAHLRRLVDRGTRLEITVPARRQRPGIVIHQSALHEDDRGSCEGIPATSTSRTLLDIAATCGGRRLERIVDRADRGGLLDRSALECLLERHPGRPGTPPAAHDPRRAGAADLDAVGTRAGLSPLLRKTGLAASVGEPVGGWL